MTIVVKPIASALGAQIDGVDLTQPLTIEVTEELTGLLHQHQVLFFRNQQMSPAVQARFAAYFGDLHIHPIYPKVPEYPQVMVLDTELNDLRDNALWHTDVTFIETPPSAAILAAKQVPEAGGDTLWASCAAAYQGLSKPMQDFVERLTAVHDISLSFPVERFAGTPQAQKQLDKVRENNPPVVHPVVRVHPGTNAKGLFVSPGFTSRIIELEELESRAILDFLFAHSTKPEYTVRWHWQDIWDNRGTMHYACDDYRPQRRIMHRATILGDRPRGVDSAISQKAG